MLTCDQALSLFFFGTRERECAKVSGRARGGPKKKGERLIAYYVKVDLFLVASLQRWVCFSAVDWCIGLVYTQVGRAHEIGAKSSARFAAPAAILLLAPARDFSNQRIKNIAAT